MSGGAKWESLKLKKGETAACRRSSQTFVQIGPLICLVSGLELQKTAGNRRKSQEAVSTPFCRRQNPGASLGTTKETKTPFTTPSRARFEWLKVAFSGLKVA